VRVVHRDAQLLVLFKPPGLPTTTPGGEHALTTVARELDPNAPRLHPSSRLDAEVSGLVIFARTRGATKALLEARRQGRYGRLYLGLASAVPRPEVGCWDHAIGIDPADPKRRVPGDTPGAQRVQPAQTDHETGERLPHACVLWMRPRTGRTHQLRVHAAWAGAPLLGDVHYGGPRRIVCGDGRVATARRVMLHCTWLRVPDPRTGDPVDFREPAPEDMMHVWDRLGGTRAALQSRD
jgi:23S rRNA-/tRNA-specific pseudouridylate synthase